MLNSDKIKGYPWFPICTGLIGCGLQYWLLSKKDGRGLLPEFTLPGTLCFVLLAVTLAVILAGLRNLSTDSDYTRWFPRSMIAGIGTVIGAVGMSFSTFTMESKGILQSLLPVLAVANMGALLFAAFSRFKGTGTNCLLYAVTDVFLMLRILACCQNWGRESQLQVYFFPLLASLFLLLACYYRAELTVKEGAFRPHIFFFSQAALFCCLLSLPGEDWLFYLSAAVWMAADFCIPAEQKHLPA